MMVLDQQTEVGDGMTWLLRKITLEKKKKTVTHDMNEYIFESFHSLTCLQTKEYIFPQQERGRKLNWIKITWIGLKIIEKKKGKRKMKGTRREQLFRRAYFVCHLSYLNQHKTGCIYRI